ncbi:Spore cortex-lytic enzyme precursor [compost metagenome]
MTPKEKELDILTRTIWGEARNQGYEGQVAVAWTIKNRALSPITWWGTDITSVCLKPWQFSCWNKNDPNYAYLSGQKAIPAVQYELAKEAARAVLEGRVPDPTGQATHYYATSMKTPPKWTVGATKTVQIRQHIFYKNVP